MPARMGGDRPGAGSGAGREPHVEAVDAEARLADHGGRQPERGAGAHREPDGELLRLGGEDNCPARRRRRGRNLADDRRRGGAHVAAGAKGREHRDRHDDEREQDELDPDAAAQAGRIAERRAAHPAQHDEHEEEHRLGDDRPPVAGRPELRDSGQLDEGAGEARAGDQHHGGQGEEGEPPDRLLVLPASQQQHELEDAAGPEGGGDDVDEVRRDRDRPSVPGPIRVARKGRGEEQGQREDEGRCDQLRPGAREGGEQDTGERHDHRDLRDPLEARRRAVCGVDEPGAAERDGEQGDRHRRRRPAHRRPRDEQEEEGRAARDQDAAEEEPAGENVEGSRAAWRRPRAPERGAPAPAAAAPTRKARTPDSR